MDDILRTFVAMLESPAYVEREHDTVWDAYMDAMGALRAAAGDNLTVFTELGRTIGACLGPMPDTVSARAAKEHLIASVRSLLATIETDKPSN